MSGFDDNKNMVLYQGFPEVPQDAFDEFDLDFQQPQLRRTYKAVCKLCYNRSETFDPLIRDVICFMCENLYVKNIQSVVRGFLVRQKLRKLRKKELMHRVFMSRGYDGTDFSILITSFI